MKNKWLEMKLAIVEKEIQKLERDQISVEVNLRKQKEKQWELINQLEKLNN
jgi:hypothetical protein